MAHLIYCVYLQPSVSSDEAWSILEQEGIEILFGSEEEGISYLYISMDENKAKQKSWPFISKIEQTPLPSIDWESQWQLHGGDFHDGYVHVDLARWSSVNQILRLQPGPGFGDLSHPTTRLVLELMEAYVPEHVVVDIGCGSGVLSVAAIALGASYLYGIDIDPEALVHSKANAVLNEMDQQCTFVLPNQFVWKPSSKPIVILMNMISSEQTEAWSSLPSLHSAEGICLTSGIRTEEKQNYLRQAESWNWKLLEIKESEDWLAFAFKK